MSREQYAEDIIKRITKKLQPDLDSMTPEKQQIELDMISYATKYAMSGFKYEESEADGNLDMNATKLYSMVMASMVLLAGGSLDFVLKVLTVA